MPGVKLKGRIIGLPAVVLTAGALTLALAAAPGQALAATQAPGRGAVTLSARSPHSQRCYPVEFIGARGSGQPYDGGGGPFRGMGPEVNKMVTVMQRLLRRKGVSSGYLPVAYPALSVNVIYPSAYEVGLILLSPLGGLLYYWHHSLGRYLASAAKGATNARLDAYYYRETCPSTVYVMVGYSQGAMAVHNAELQMVTHHNSDLVKLLAGTIVLGDGDRVSHTRAREFGTSPAAGKGIRAYIQGFLHVGGTPHDVLIPKTTANICDNLDFVCDFNLNAIRHVSEAFKVHTSYAKCTKSNRCTYKRVLSTAARWVAGLVLRRLLG